MTKKSSSRSRGKTPADPTSSSRDWLVDWLAGHGEMAERIRSFDWATTSIGPMASWSPALRTMLRLLLTNRFPHILWWGPQYIQFYNDPYRPIPGSKHPDRALGRPANECWSEIWHILQPLIDTPFNGGPPTWDDDIFLEINRHGFIEETHFTIAYSPVPDETMPSGIGGVLATVHEITEKVVGERRVIALRDLGCGSMEAKTADEACVVAAETLAQHSKDIPFALLYLIDAHRKRARLAGTAGVAGSRATPPVVELGAEPDDQQPWPLTEVIRTEMIQVVEGLADRFGGTVPPGPWSDPPRQAVIVPIRSNIAHQLAGFLVAGVSARLKLDELYRDFYEFVAGRIATAIANARAYEEERRRAESLAELDRAKTAFFSNVSHEFRTPLTLMLGPLEDVLAGAEPLPSGAREHLTITHRNGLRLLKLVNSLLDFSRIEAGRMQASYQPTDLSTATVDLASVFRSAIEKAGLRLVVDCPPLPEPVYVDRDMWEKIVLNLMSNAFKFTFDGTITVALRRVGDLVELSVADTGVGIAADNIPHLFERFYRVEGGRGRTYEGSGIGLALVQELVKLHGGTVRAESRIGDGSVFIVTVPLGTAHLPADRIGAGPTSRSTVRGAASFVEETARWLPDTGANEELGMRNEACESAHSTFHTPHSSCEPQAKPRVLFADDNADMRDYVRRLLAERYDVTAVVDGEAALVAAKRSRPDLILADVMMPRLDGFGLLRELRDDPDTRSIPVILLSARAGEESRVEGLERGADDYLIKPFSARELMARVDARLEIARVRQASEEELRASEARLRAFADNAPAMLWVTESDGSCSFLSRGWYDFTGQTEREGLGFGWLDGVHPDDRGASRRTLLSANERHAPFRLEYRLRRHDGEYRWAIDDAVPRFGAGGEFLGYIGSVLDITDRKQAEAALHRLNSELEVRVEERTRDLIISQERLRALATELNLAEQRERRRLATELHDYLAQLLALSKIKLTQAKRQPMAPPMSKALTDIQDVMDQALTYTRTMVAQLSPPELHEFGLPSALKWLTEQMKEHGLAVELDLKRDMAPLPEDQAVLLFQSVRELLLNVVKHGRTNHAKVSVIEAEGMLRVAVMDQGAGFDLTAARASSTSGFGLFSIRERMVSLGGRFELLSRPDEGTQATLILPRAPRTATAADVELGTRSEDSTCQSSFEPKVKVRVLLVDDHAMVRQGLRGLLDAYADVEIVGEAANGEQAVALTDQLQPSVILMDVNMPKMDGIRATKRIKQEMPAAIVIGLSVQNGEDVEAAMREAGASAFLNKEAAVEQLYQTIQAMRSAALT